VFSREVDTRAITVPERKVKRWMQQRWERRRPAGEKLGGFHSSW